MEENPILETLTSTTFYEAEASLIVDHIKGWESRVGQYNVQLA